MASPQITRVSGAGNTFFFWNTAGQDLPPESRSGLVRFLCDSFTGFYTDGMAFLDPASEPGCDFTWDFYNADGSSAEMCGNAARCAAIYFKERMGGKTEALFVTRAGRIESKILEPHTVQIRMPLLKNAGEFVEVQTGKRKMEFFAINTGVPHVVVEGEPNEELAQALRRAPEWGDAGSNVTFYNEVGPGEIEAITFERGVENFTLACGTGAVAAAAFSLAKNPLLKKHSVEMPGGVLQVEWISPLQALLTGPAQIEFDLTFSEGIA